MGDGGDPSTDRDGTSADEWQRSQPYGYPAFVLQSGYWPRPRSAFGDRPDPRRAEIAEPEFTLGHSGRCRLIEDATKLRWDLRPSNRFPTLEMRITDCSTTLEDKLSIAALFRCLLRMLWRLKRENQRWRLYARMLIDENRRRAQRYGFDQGLVSTRSSHSSFRLWPPLSIG